MLNGKSNFFLKFWSIWKYGWLDYNLVWMIIMVIVIIIWLKPEILYLNYNATSIVTVLTPLFLSNLTILFLENRLWYAWKK